MVLLSFDIEEFDLPTEYNQAIDFAEQIKVSSEGLERILAVLEQENVRATFYSTSIFMEAISEDLRQRLLSGGHEIASHGVSHSSFKAEDYRLSRQKLQELTGQDIRGFRMARMQAIDHNEQIKAGYTYDSSLNPTFLPGRYNHLNKKRLPHLIQENFWELPASVLPLTRFPLFWLSMHLLPLAVYKRLMHYTAKRDAYLNVYYHPWEFASLKDLPYQIPAYIKHNSGLDMQARLSSLIKYLKSKGHCFGTTSEYLQSL